MTDLVTAKRKQTMIFCMLVGAVIGCVCIGIMLTSPDLKKFEHPETEVVETLNFLTIHSSKAE